MKNVLIADDDAVMVRLLELTMRKSGFSVTICRDGPSVLQRVFDRKPDLGIIDLMLPGMSGLELIREFKSDSSLRDIPLIVVTGQGKGSTKSELLRVGAVSVFTKPFSPTALTSRVRELLSDAAE